MLEVGTVGIDETQVRSHEPRLLRLNLISDMNAQS